MKRLESLFDHDAKLIVTHIENFKEANLDFLGSDKIDYHMLHDLCLDQCNFSD